MKLMLPLFNRPVKELDPKPKPTTRKQVLTINAKKAPKQKKEEKLKAPQAKAPMAQPHGNKTDEPGLM